MAESYAGKAARCTSFKLTAFGAWEWKAFAFIFEITYSNTCQQSTQMGMTLRFGFSFHRRQPVQDAAGINRLFGLTALAQRSELQLELRQFMYALIDMGNVLIENRIDGATAFVGAVGQAQQRVNFFITHV